MSHTPTAGRKAHNGLTIRAYLGTCVVCRYSCYEGDETARGRGQWLGLCHQRCLERVSK